MSLLNKLEYWDGNTYYGIGCILKKYARLPILIPLNFTIQHGITIFSVYSSLDECKQIVNFYIPKNKDTTFLMFNEEYLPYFYEKNIFNVKAIGAPIIYMDEFIEQTKSKITEKKGTIVFPHNSTHHIDVKTNFTEYAKQLKELSSKFHPIKVCMYYLDIEKGYDKPFRDAGFEIIQNGNLWSKKFLYNFIRNVAPFEYATSNNNMSSTCYYSIYLGLKYFRYGPSVEYNLKGKCADLYAQEYPILHDHENIFGFSIDDCENYEYQMQIANNELGVNTKLSRKELREMILKALDKNFLKRYTKTVLLRLPLGRNILSFYNQIRAAKI